MRTMIFRFENIIKCESFCTMYLITDIHDNDSVTNHYKVEHKDGPTYPFLKTRERAEHKYLDCLISDKLAQLGEPK